MIHRDKEWSNLNKEICLPSWKWPNVTHTHTPIYCTYMWIYNGSIVWEVREKAVYNTREINPFRTAVIIRKCFNPDDVWVMDIEHRSTQEWDISLSSTNNRFYSHEADDDSEKIRLPCCLMCTIAHIVIPNIHNSPSFNLWNINLEYIFTYICSSTCIYFAC